MRIVTRDPFTHELESWRNTMEQLLNELPRSGYQEARPWVLPLDVIETENEYIVKASIPAVNPDDLDITISDNILTIKGEVKDESEQTKGRYHVRERRYGLFQRSIALPERVEAGKIEATYEDGVLKLSIPKAEEIKPKRISVKTK